MNKPLLWLGVMLTSLLPAYGQQLNKVQKQYLSDHAAIVLADTLSDTFVWEPLLRDIGDKRIVLLGEFSHGAGEIFEYRNDLIRQLHQQLGFEVILFESGFGEVAYANLFKEEHSSRRMAYSLIGPWRTAEFRDLMDYVKTRALDIDGFDVQRSGGAFKNLVRKLEGDTSLFFELEDRFSVLRRKLPNRKTKPDEVEKSTIQLIADYKQAIEVLRQESENEWRYVRQTLVNRIAFLDYMWAFVNDKDYRRRWAARDSIMASNVRWLLDGVYQNKKVIILGHNYHIANFNEKESVMGEYLRTDYGAQMYSIGFFGMQGHFKNNYGKVEQLAEPDTGHMDVKHLIRALEAEVCYLHMDDQNTQDGQWPFGRITVNDSFIDLNGSNQLDPSRQFDALILIRHISAPDP